MSASPPQPVYTLRGHAGSVNALRFFGSNRYLLAGDADGFVVVWSLLTKRAVRVWRAHAQGVVGVGVWQPAHDVTETKVLSQGRDGRLCVWDVDLSAASLATAAAQGWSTVLPVAGSEDALPRSKPWLAHVLTIDSVGFCAFGMLSVPAGLARDVQEEEVADGAGLLLALPSADPSAITLVHLPSQRQVGYVPGPLLAEGEAGKVGMLMSVKVCRSSLSSEDEEGLVIVAGYESGRVCVFRRVLVQQDSTNASSGGGPTQAAFEMVYSHRTHVEPVLSVSISPDLTCFFSSGADSIVAKHALPLSSKAPSSSGEGEPLQSVKTRHPGQQSLEVRSDGKILATAGWDSMIRVYSAKTLRELAVLKFHREGCYAVAFGDISSVEQDVSGQNVSSSTETSLMSTKNEMKQMTVSQAREMKTKQTHWIAAGSKDGKISLWDIY